MARGWESKAIEAQQDAAAERPRKNRVLSAADAALASKRATLMLARSRALADLQNACAAPHRAMLEQAIAHIDQQLAALGPGESS